MEGPLLRVQDAAHLLQVSKWTVYRWIEEGRLKATKIGRGSLRVFRTSVESLITANRTESWELPARSSDNVVSIRSATRKKK
ncbi:MAG: helix-turn-helix domain-containing protein [Nitrospira sp.]